VLGRGLRKEFPNPKRIGCPGAEVLKKIASRKMPLSEVEVWLDHLGSCSPCYNDFSQFQSGYGRRQMRRLLALAASILILAGLAGWALVPKQKKPLATETAMLDLRNRSIPRGTKPNPAEPPLGVNRAAAHWSILLPFGSNDGPYDIRLLAGSGELLVSTKANAKLIDGVAVIHISVDLSSRSPGQCVLRLTRNGSQESSYVVELR